jgi:drug/metabolite transporter (DMT)-like permease
MLATIMTAVGAAALFAVAAALQHRSAGLVAAAGRDGTGRDGTGRDGAGRDGAAIRTLRHPLWIAGSLASLAGLGLHALALRNGPLTLVQPLLVTGVIFALPLRQVLEHRRPRGAELGWAAALALGLTVFIVAATPAGGPAQAADPGPALGCAAALGLGVPGCVAASRRATGDLAALALGTAAGLAFAATAALLKQVTAELGHGAAVLLTTWPGYALIAVGGLGLLLSQLAYRAGPLRASLPAVTAVNPIASLVIGVAVFDERFSRRGAVPVRRADRAGADRGRGGGPDPGRAGQRPRRGWHPGRGAAAGGTAAAVTAAAPSIRSHRVRLLALRTRAGGVSGRNGRHRRPRPC